MTRGWAFSWRLLLFKEGADPSGKCSEIGLGSGRRILSCAGGTGEHRVILLALCGVPLLKEGRSFCQALPGDMEWSLVPQHHVCHVSLA